jgi:hypothetical protein
MQFQPPIAERTVAVFLGASRYPNHTELESVQGPLQRSYECLLNYVTSKEGLSVRAVIDLFNKEHNAQQMMRVLRDELHARYADLGSDLPIDVLLFYFGHGHLIGQDRSVHFAIMDTSRDDVTASTVPASSLSQALARGVPVGRFYVLLDCCRAADAMKRMSFDVLDTQDMGVPQSAIGRSRVDDTAGPTRGGAILAAAGPNANALAPPHEQYTRFTMMLLEALRESGPRTGISLSEAYDRMRRVKTRLEGEGVWPGRRTPEPQIHVPSQKGGGLVSLLPLFRTPWPRPKPIVCIVPDTTTLTCVVVTRENRPDNLVARVRSALRDHRAQIQRFARKTIVDANKCVVQIDVGTAFIDDEMFERCVHAIAHADLAVFDVTDDEPEGVQPGIMFLLGVRATARRGVSICSIDRHSEQLFRAELPYNLQFLNIASHAGGHREGEATFQLKQKIVKGFEGLYEDPYYLDLPAYDALRSLGGQASDYAPERYFDAPLMLTPFDDAYDEVFRSTIWPGLRGVLLERAYELDRFELEGQETLQPRRLSARAEARMVTQTLYRSIRRCEFCVVDWTLLKPNVMYEAGVRIASHPRGAIHIVADIQIAPPNGTRVPTAMGAWPVKHSANAVQKKRDKERVEALAALNQVRDLSHIFLPIQYGKLNEQSADEVWAEMFRRFEDSVDDESVRGRKAYSIVGKAQAWGQVNPLGLAEKELSKIGRLLYVGDEDSRQLTVLFGDEDSKLEASTIVRALDYRAAAILLARVRLAASGATGGNKAMVSDLKREVRDLELIALDLKGHSEELHRYAQELLRSVAEGLNHLS